MTSLYPLPEWVEDYRGLWGLYARDPWAGEDAPAGPMYNRDGTPREVWDTEAAYAEWLPGTMFPKLFVNAEPGAFLTGDKRAFCRGWPNQEEVTVPGLHFLQEDSPAEIGAALAAWIARLPTA